MSSRAASPCVHHHLEPVPGTSPVALTLIAIKCFEWLVKDSICAFLPKNLDPLQLVYQSNRCRSNAISHVLHITLINLGKRQGNYAMMHFIDFTSAFHTTDSSRLISKHTDLGLDTVVVEICEPYSVFLYKFDLKCVQSPKT